MAITFADQDLFSTGRATLHVGGRSLRHSLHELPGEDGAHLQATGRGSRSLTQIGDLLADNADAMRQQFTAIEALMDGQPHELVDDRGQTWADTVMIGFDPEPAVPVGRRLLVRYRVNYLQLQ